jgi:DNA invertase Pin-like site-specific DNA recombinase
VICENIERAGRDMHDALRLEKELHAAGIVIFATDEPIDARAPKASTILVRRKKQGIAGHTGRISPPVSLNRVTGR